MTITAYSAMPSSNKKDLISIDVTVSTGLGIHVTGMNTNDYKSMLLRVLTALQSQGYHIPKERITIGIFLPRETMSTTFLDLPIALALLKATGQERLNELEYIICGGCLNLDGSLRYPNDWNFISHRKTKSCFHVGGLKDAIERIEAWQTEASC